MKKLSFIILLLLFPLQVFAYSNKLIVKGNPIGIEIHSNGVYIIDFYKINNHYIGKEAGFRIGDQILEVNHQKINSINELNKEINKEENYTVTIKRNNQIKEIDIVPKKENNVLKTGLYVKDEINGIGTLSYIDPETKIYASLGHEILESSSMQLFDTSHGYIYEAELNGIKKSKDGLIGEYQASFNNQILGTINNNDKTGIFGKYQDPLKEETLIEVASKDEILKGTAYIRMNMGEEKDYEINILSISEKDPVKNIFFEIKDDALLQETGGIVQGMSGSPMIQNNKIIGVVNYVVINEPNKGYGIFIETMLEEGDKLLQE